MSTGNSMIDAYKAGQSLWLVYISLSFLYGALQAFIANDLVM